MSNVITKEMTILEADGLVNYYSKIRGDEKTKNKFNIFSLPVQWNLKKNIDILSKAISSYIEFRNEKQQEIKDKYFNEEKSMETMVKQSSNGEEKEVPGRQIKPEFVKEFQSENAELITSLYNLATEKITVEIYPINLDEEISKLDHTDTNDIIMDDLDFLDSFKA